MPPSAPTAAAAKGTAPTRNVTPAANAAPTAIGAARAGHGRDPSARLVHPPSRLRLLKYGWLSLGLIVLAEGFALRSSGPPDLIFTTLVVGFSVLMTAWATLDREDPATRPNPFVSLRLDREACFPGGSLKGELMLRVAPGARLREVRLAVTGVVPTPTIVPVNSWNSASGVGVGNVNVPVFRYYPPLVAVAGAPPLPNGVPAPAVVPPGEHTYAFTVLVPRSSPLSLIAPASIYSPGGAKYAVDVVARPNALRPALRCRLNFLVVAPP